MPVNKANKNQNTYIVVSQTSLLNKSTATYNIVPINCKMNLPTSSMFTDEICDSSLKPGDIVAIKKGEGFQKCDFSGCEQAIVLGNTIKWSYDDNQIVHTITAFSLTRGDITVQTPTHLFYQNPSDNVQRGDKILVRNTAPEGELPEFEIVTNITANELRAKFIRQMLLAQQQKQK